MSHGHDNAPPDTCHQGPKPGAVGRRAGVCGKSPTARSPHGSTRLRTGILTCVAAACPRNGVRQPVRHLAQRFALPSFDEVHARWHSSDWVLLARDGEPLQRTRIDHTERRGDWVALADVSPALREAIVVSEDKRFYEHSGVDWRGAAGAAWANLWNTRTRGASTVTMQLTGLLDDDPQRSGQRSIAQKAGQAVNALWLERTLAQGPDSRGLSESGAVSRRNDRFVGAVDDAVRQGALRAR